MHVEYILIKYIFVYICIYFFSQDGTLKSDILTNELLPDLNKVVAAALLDAEEDAAAMKSPLLQTKVDSLSPVLEFLEGKNCLTGVS